jgi:hypothetical protein
MDRPGRAAHTYYVVLDGLGAVVGATIHAQPLRGAIAFEVFDAVQRRVREAGGCGGPYRWAPFAQCCCPRPGCCPPIEWALDDETARAIAADEEAP